jgi:hypothetical protein
LDKTRKPNGKEVYRASTIVADRLCGASADPIVRNAQERRQLELIGTWLEKRGYKRVTSSDNVRFDRVRPGAFAVHLNFPVKLNEQTQVNIPIDVAIQPKSAKKGEFPILIEAKSAGDFTNTNKRRKEEAKKADQLRKNYGQNVRFILFLCGYFDTGYLGYEAAEGIDWVWEHRIDDLSQLGI